mmetsp:Transcript_23989/g.36840  ORF Transcript_23989/g.36840 Transcript_23989/m.36840 type:complete len:84 (-) Transcript_23989:1980-2231(-)
MQTKVAPLPTTRRQVINPELPTFGDRTSPKVLGQIHPRGASRGVKRAALNLVDGEENHTEESVTKATIPTTSGLRRPPSKNGH